jgi:hypothetical protein
MRGDPLVPYLTLYNRKCGNNCFSFPPLISERQRRVMSYRLIFKRAVSKSPAPKEFFRPIQNLVCRSCFSCSADRPNLNVSGVEEKIFKTLDRVVQDFDLNTEVRVAGGWVRNKLLGLDGGDIDIALTNMSGLEFANHLKRSLRLRANKKGGGADDLGSYLIKANPEQSKHLETAAVCLNGVWLDFVNMRSEVYVDDSGRIPQMSFATPGEDANRRDFTVNSMFYNIRSRELEDFTAVGLNDLRNNILRTPPSRPTLDVLLEDPLRAYRAVRFAATYGFQLDKDLQAALATPQLHEAIKRKIRGERITTEMRKMYDIPDRKYLEGLGVLGQTGLGPVMILKEPDSGYCKKGENKANIDFGKYVQGVGTENEMSVLKDLWGKGRVRVDTLSSMSKIDASDPNGAATWGISLTVASMVSVLAEFMPMKEMVQMDKSTEASLLLGNSKCSNRPYTNIVSATVLNDAEAKFAEYRRLQKVMDAVETAAGMSEKRFFVPFVASKLRGVAKDVSKLANLIFIASQIFPLDAYELIKARNLTDASLSVAFWLHCFDKGFCRYGMPFVEASITLACIQASPHDSKQAEVRSRALLDLFGQVGGGLSLETTVAVGHSLVDGKEISTLTKAVGRDIRRLKSTGQLWNLFSLVLGEGNKKEDCLEFLYVLQRQDDQTGLK